MGLGERSSSPSGSGQSPAAKQFLVYFRAENASGDNHCLDEFLCENPLIPYLTCGDIAVGGSGRNLLSVYLNDGAIMWKRNRYDVFSRLSRTHEGDVSSDVSRSRHHLTLNISQMAKNMAIVAIEYK